MNLMWIILAAEKIIQQKLLLVSDDVVDDWEQHLDEEPKPDPVPAAASCTYC